MEKISPSKQTHKSQFQLRQAPTAGSAGPRNYRSKVNGKGLNPAARASKVQQQNAIELPPSAPALPKRSVAPEPAQPFKPTKANSLKLLEAQATDPLPATLNDLPPYRHIFIGVQFDELYTPLYAELDDQAEAAMPDKLKENKQSNDFIYGMPKVRKTIPCERLGRHLIFNGFALVRDFITSPEVRADQRFQDREPLAMELTEKLYAFTLAKINAGNFTIQEFVDVNLLMGLIVDWRKGLIEELQFEIGLGNTSDQVIHAFEKLSPKEQDEQLRLSCIFDKVNQAIELKSNQLDKVALFKDILLDHLFHIKPNHLSKGFYYSCKYQSKDFPLISTIGSNHYDQLHKLKPYFGYTDCNSGIGEMSFIKATYEVPDAVLTTFDPNLGFLKDADGIQSHSRFSPNVKPTAKNDYHYNPHYRRLSTAVEPIHDAIHWQTTEQVNYEFKQRFGHSLVQILKPCYDFFKDPKSNNFEIIKRFNFFFLHEFGSLQSVTARDRAIKRSFLNQLFNMFRSQKTKEAELKTKGFRVAKRNTAKTKDLKSLLLDLVKNTQDLMCNFYSWDSNYFGYKSLYRDLELILHEEMVPFPEDGEKKFTYKPLKDKDGKPLLPTFQELYDGALKDLNALKKSPEKTEALRKIAQGQTLREKWKALPKGIRNDAKSKALSDGYKRFFETASNIIDKHIPKEAFDAQAVPARAD
jgi:hypothetical protein